MTVPVALAGVWVLSGIAAAVIAVRAICRALDRPLTDTDRYCACVDRELTEREHAVIVGSRLDAIDTRAQIEQADLEREFVAEVEAWLRARTEETA